MKLMQGAEAMFCISCGINLPDFAAFCSKCGTSVSDVKHEEVSKRDQIDNKRGAQAAPEASTEPISERPPGQVTSLKKSPSGIGGWLGFFVFSLFGNGVLLSFESLNMKLEISNAVPMGLGLLLAVLAFWSAILILRKNPRGILLSKVFIGGNLFLDILAMLGSIHDPSALVAASVGLARVATFSLIWITYLQRSVRVRNTFAFAANKPQAGLEETSTIRETAQSIPTSQTISDKSKAITKISIGFAVLIVAAIVGLILIATGVGNESRNAPHAATRQVLPPPFTSPTATDVFNLRTKCTELAQQLDESLPTGVIGIEIRYPITARE